jgi:CRP-like cAMP-binding protein
MSETAIHSIRDEFLDTEYGASLLKSLPFFKNFRIDELQRVYALGEIQVYNESANIMIEHEETVGAYLILEGRVGIFKEKIGIDRKGFLIATLAKGDSFGELSLLDRAPRSATVTALSRCVLFYLDGAVWTQALDQDTVFSARFYFGFALMLAERLRTLDSQFVLSQKQLWEMAFKNGGQSQEMQELKHQFVFKKHADAFVLDKHVHPPVVQTPPTSAPAIPFPSKKTPPPSYETEVHTELMDHSQQENETQKLDFKLNFSNIENETTNATDLKTFLLKKDA